MSVVLFGCAAGGGPPAAPDPHELDAFLSVAPDSPRTESEFQGAGGARLGFIAYRQNAQPMHTALVYLHGIESHAGWFDMAAMQLLERGYDVYCLDRRGSGINRENRGFTSGHVDSYETLLNDIRHFVVPLRSHYRRVYLTGLSWGGKLALAYALHDPQDCDGLILITPGIRALVDVSSAVKLGIAFDSVMRPQARYALPIEPEMFTTTPRYLEYIRTDPLRLRQATARFLFESRRLDGFIDRRVAANELPILLFLAGGDRIIDNEGVRAVLRRGAQQVEIRLYEDQTHSIQFDAPDRLVEDVVRWLKGREKEGEST